MCNSDDLLEKFERDRIDPAAFSHRSHVQVAHALMLRHPFSDALPRMVRGIRAIADRAGKPENYNDTITTAFLSLVAERLARTCEQNFDAFARLNDDLFKKDALSIYYSAARLHSDVAREMFLMPDMLKAAL